MSDSSPLDDPNPEPHQALSPSPDGLTHFNRLPSDPQEISQLMERLASLAKTLHSFDAFVATSQGEHFEQLKRRNLSMIEGKLMVELEAHLQLPLFVSLIGGTNTGKSTLFNALAGEILSATTITASATKHPIIYVHERWRSVVMESEMFSHATLLSSPGELLIKPKVLEGSSVSSGSSTELSYQTFASFHQRPELEHIALIDCPDLDSFDHRSAQIAQRMIQRSDLCVFVTTPQKYKDAVLIETLQALLHQARQVFVLFNLTDDEVTHRTMFVDLKRTLEGTTLTLGAPLRTEPSAEPERALHQEATEALRGFLTHNTPEAIKQTLLTRQLDILIKSSQELVGEYRDQTDRKDEVLTQLERHVDSAVHAYQDQFALPFPELGEALAHQINHIELQRIFRPKISPEENPKWSIFFAHGFGLAGQKLRNLFVRSFEFGAPPKDWEVFWRQRDEQDLAQLRHHAQLLRASIEQSLRVGGQDSVVAQLLLTRFFTADELIRFDESLQSVFWETVEEEPSLGRDILTQSQGSDANQGGLLKWSAAWMANAVKAVIGLMLSWLTFGFGMWDLVLFFPLGFIGGAYALTWLLYLRLKRKESVFKKQRVALAKKLFTEVQIQPMTDCVQQVASREDLEQLTESCQHIQAVISPT